MFPDNYWTFEQPKPKASPSLSDAKPLSKNVVPVTVTPSKKFSNTVNFPNDPNEYFTPSEGAKLKDAYGNPLVPVDGGAGYMYTPVDLGGTGTGGGGWGFGGGSGGGGKGKVKWSNMYAVDNAPSWWQGLVPSKYDATTSYLALINAMIPSMSPEDQQSTATYLATAFPDAFKMYNPGTVTNFTKAPDAITSTERQAFQSTGKSNQTLGTLDKLLATMTAQTGKKKEDVEKTLGSGYTFLRSLASTMKQYGGTSNTEQQTRRQYLNQASQLDPLLAMGKGGTLAPYAPIAQKLAQPYFTAGQLTPLVSGKFGTPNKQLFG